MKKIKDSIIVIGEAITVWDLGEKTDWKMDKLNYCLKQQWKVWE